MSKKSVSFHPINTIIITYSADEYDRSCFASVIPTTYTFRPIVDFTQQQPVITLPSQSSTKRPMIKPLDLSVIPNSARRALDSPPLTPPAKTKKKPKLSINTTACTPLFFSGLSTHYKCKEGEEEEHGYLVPIMSAC